MAKPINLKLKSGGLSSHDNNMAIATFKLKGKRHKSKPMGYLAMNKDASTVHMGYDYNNDGVIEKGHKEAFARFVIEESDPFGSSKSNSDLFFDKYSNAGKKGRLQFKPMPFSDELTLINGKVDAMQLVAPTQIKDGDIFTTTNPSREGSGFDYKDFSDLLMSNGAKKHSTNDDKTSMHTMYEKRGAAKKAAKEFGCTGAHSMGDYWMPCRDHSLLMSEGLKGEKSEDHSNSDYDNNYDYGGNSNNDSGGYSYYWSYEITNTRLEWLIIHFKRIFNAKHYFPSQ